tara:strand:+ start:9529 stop:10077 length:549 start_codon:yes stop_codon:yes gene_type:complete
MKDNLENRVKDLQNQFDFEEPSVGHFERFEARLSNNTNQDKTVKWNPATWKWLAVAASILLMVGFWFGSYSSTPQQMELADVSPKMKEAQSFFVSTIQYEIEQVNLQRNDTNEKIITDAFDQLKILEQEYLKLTKELESDQSNRGVIYAMVSNFQQRIEVLQRLLEQLDDVKKLNIEELNQA